MIKIRRKLHTDKNMYAQNIDIYTHAHTSGKIAIPEHRGLRGLNIRKKHHTRHVIQGYKGASTS